MNSHENFIFYDGDCGFCNRSVQFILKNEKEPNAKFCPLQAEFAEKTLGEYGIKEIKIDTIYYLKDARVYERSQAAFQILSTFKWYWQIFQIFRILPVSWTDRLYNLIAKYRKSLVGTYCVIPDSLTKSRFIA